MFKLLLVSAFVATAFAEGDKKPDTRFLGGGGGGFPHGGGLGGGLGGVGGGFPVGGGGFPVGGGGFPVGGGGFPGAGGGFPVAGGGFPGQGGVFPGAGGVSPGGLFPGQGGSKCNYCKDPYSGQYVCCKAGRCPPVRPECPGTRFHVPVCYQDLDCSGSDKCCPDACLEHRVCKPIVLGSQG